MTYLDTALNGELEKLRSGSAGRNNTLFKVAARLYQFSEAGAVTEDYVTDLLTSEASAIGLDRNEIKSTLRSARKHADGHPATLPNGVASATQQPVDPSPPESVDLPSEQWRHYAGVFVGWAGRRLWHSMDSAAAQARDYLYKRGLTNATIIHFDLGYNPTDLVRSRAAWDIPADDQRGDRLWLPAGIVIPWFVDGELWRVSIRRPIEGPSKYYNVPGGANTLYNADSLHAGKPAALVEGVLDVMAIHQGAGDLCGAVASGTTGARRMRWITRLVMCRPVLIAFDQDDAGEAAAAWWAMMLGQVGKRWRPLVDDPAAMLANGADIHGWLQAAL